MGMVDINLNIKPVIKALNAIEREQLPFVVAKTLTEIAKGAQKAVQKQTDRKFHSRSEWVKKGVRIETAKKKTVQRYGFGEAIVKHIDDYMTPQETGGEKKLLSHGKSTKRKAIAIPEKNIAEQMRGSSGAIQKKFKPKTLLNKPASSGRPRKWGRHKKAKPFIMTSNTNDHVVIAMRKGNERYPLKYLYVLAHRAKIKPRYDFRKIVKGYAEGTFSKKFAENMMAAMNDRKVKG